MRLRKFNESESKKSETIWCVVMKDEEGYIFSNAAFTSEILAEDYFIKYVNNKYGQKFEPFFDKDGNRFFTSIDENPDLEKCLEYYDEEIYPNQEIKIIETELYSNPKI